jgi:hypothetical protein
MAARRSHFELDARMFVSRYIRRFGSHLPRREGPVRILFDAHNGMHLVCLRPLIDALMAVPNVRVALMNSWEPSLSPARELFASFGYAGDLVVAPDLRTRWRRWDLYVCASHPPIRRSWLWQGTPRVYAEHGVSGARHPDAKWWELDEDKLPAYAAVFITGELFMPKGKQQAGRIGYGHVPRLVGFPKLDRLADGPLDGEAVRARLDLDRSRPTVMVAPTWSHWSLAESAYDFDEILAMLAREARYNVLLKLHHLSQVSKKDNWSARLKTYLEHPNFRLIDDPDALPYLVVSDALITDHSTIGFEYAVLDRPLFQYDHPNVVYDPPEVRQMCEEAAYRFRHPRELRVLLEWGLARPSERSAARRALAQACFYKCGTATKRAVAILLDLASGKSGASA